MNKIKNLNHLNLLKNHQEKILNHHQKKALKNHQKNLFQDILI